MRRRRLGGSGLIASEIGLGTMNFGSQLSEQEAHGVLDAATAIGINFIDTAEMYPGPAAQKPYGLSEEVIGRWLANTIIALKEKKRELQCPLN